MMRIRFYQLSVAVFFACIIATAAAKASVEMNSDDRLSRPSISLETIKMRPDETGAVAVELQGVLEDKPFSLHGNLGSLLHAVDPDLLWPVDLTLEIVGTKFKIDGVIQDVENFRGLDLNVRLSGKDGAGLGELLGIGIPIDGPFQLTGILQDAAPKVFRFADLRLTWKKSDINGFCSFDFSGDIPIVDLDLKSSHLAIRGIAEKDDNLLADDRQSPVQEERPAGSQKVFSQKPFNFDFLNVIHLKVDLKAKKVLLPGWAFTDFHMKTVMKGGVLSIEPIRGNIGGGKLDGRFKMSSAGEGVEISTILNIEKMDLKRFLKDMGLKLQGEGDVDIHIDLDAGGGSVAELMAGINGAVSLVMGKGKFDRNYLKYLGLFQINLISTIVKVIDMSTGGKTSGEVSDVNCMAVRLDAKDGMADLSALVLDRPSVCLLGSGRINLGTEEIKIYIKPIPKEGIGAEGLAQINLSLSELTKSFLLGGTLANPKVSVDTTRTIFTLGKAIGGAVLFGPAGLAVALFSGKIGSHPENPCLDAIEAAERGVEIDEEKKGVFKGLEKFLKELNPIN